MKSKDDIKKMLPNRNEKAENIKAISPRTILHEYLNAINEKYVSYLSANIFESSRIQQANDGDTKIIMSYSFYIIANIARGYNYKLFEVVPQTFDSPYPVELIFFEKYPSNEGLFNESDFIKRIDSFFQGAFFDNVVNNLIGQVELYREHRSDI